MKKKTYAKPVIVAQNNKNGSFAAGCPEHDSCNGGNAGGSSPHNNQCHKCERTK